MTYKVYSVNRNRLGLVLVGILISLFVLMLLNAHYKVIPQEIIGAALLLFILGGLPFSFFWNDGNRTYELKKQGIIISGKLIAWQDIKSYKHRDENVDYNELKIWTKSRTYKICHRSKFDATDDFKKLLKDFEKAVEQENKDREIKIIKRPSVWDTQKGKVYAYILIAIILAFFYPLITNFSIKTLTYFLIFVGACLPLLVRALSNNKSRPIKIFGSGQY